MLNVAGERGAPAVIAGANALRMHWYRRVMTGQLGLGTQPDLAT